MGTDKHEAEKRSPRRRRNQARGTADYAVLDANLLLQAVCNVSKHGGALRFGYTSDGGAFAIGIYGDGDPYTDYVKPTEDLDAYFRELAEAWDV